MLAYNLASALTRLLSAREERMYQEAADRLIMTRQACGPEDGNKLNAAQTHLSNLTLQRPSLIRAFQSPWLEPQCELLICTTQGPKEWRSQFQSMLTPAPTSGFHGGAGVKCRSRRQGDCAESAVTLALSQSEVKTQTLEAWEESMSPSWNSSTWEPVTLHKMRKAGTLSFLSIQEQQRWWDYRTRTRDWCEQPLSFTFPEGSELSLTSACSSLARSSWSSDSWPRTKAEFKTKQANTQRAESKVSISFLF